MDYQPAINRYEQIPYRRCGNSGLLLPALSLGLRFHFGGVTPFDTQQNILRKGFDLGITHFDLANNYGPPYGEAERNFGIHMDRDWHTHRDELIISTKAGYDMWEGPYGDHGSRKHLISSLDQSLKRMHLDYVDIFYHHRPDPDTPIEETMGALDQIVRSGKALYVGISNYNAEQTRIAIKTLEELGTPMLVHQAKYSMLVRDPEQGLAQVLREEGVGCIAFAALYYGVLTNKYLKPGAVIPSNIPQATIEKVKKLTAIAERRGQSMAQLALLWVLRNPEVTSSVIGASRPEQVEDNVRAFDNPILSDEELEEIESILSGE